MFLNVFVRFVPNLRKKKANIFVGLPIYLGRNLELSKLSWREKEKTKNRQKETRVANIGPTLLDIPQGFSINTVIIRKVVTTYYVGHV